MPKWPSPRERALREKLLLDPNVQRWIRRLEKGAPSTSDVWPRRLAAFCVRFKLTPAKLLEMQATEIVDLLDDYERQERSKGRQGSYVAFTVKVVRSWLRYAGRDLPRGAVKVREADRVFQETALSKDALRSVLDSSSSRERVAVALMAMSGLRPMVLGNYNGDDGLRVGDLPDVTIEGKSVLFTKVPLRIAVRQELSKAGHIYCTFLGVEGSNALKSYFEIRLRAGERFSADTPVIVPERAKRAFIRTANIGDLVRHALRSSHLPDRPYVLRTTFATRLLSAENEGRVSHSFAQFWMGHTGDMTARYTTNRGQLPAEVLEDMRTAYGRCESYLATAEPRDDTSIQLGLLETLLQGMGLDTETAKKGALGELTREEILRLMDEAKKANMPDPPMDLPPGTQRVIPNEWVNSWLGHGWRIQCPVGTQRVAVLSP